MIHTLIYPGCGTDFSLINHTSCSHIHEFYMIDSLPGSEYGDEINLGADETYMAIFKDKIPKEFKCISSENEYPHVYSDKRRKIYHYFDCSIPFNQKTPDELKRAVLKSANLATIGYEVPLEFIHYFEQKVNLYLESATVYTLNDKDKQECEEYNTEDLSYFLYIEPTLREKVNKVFYDDKVYFSYNEFLKKEG